jgi:hypothetical protein
MVASRAKADAFAFSTSVMIARQPIYSARQ